jgi:uncharacterized protein YndB with AHSA1/START domain
MTYAIKHLFHINAKRSDVFKAISTIEGLANWWTVHTTGSVDVEGIIKFRFGEHGGPDFKVLEIKPNESITWQCVESTHGWEGHTLKIQLDENAGKTRVRFSHSGWAEQDDNYAGCCFSWSLYMVSLRQLCQTGKGEPFGGEGFKR